MLVFFRTSRDFSFWDQIGVHTGNDNQHQSAGRHKGRPTSSSEWLDINAWLLNHPGVASIMAFVASCVIALSLLLTFYPVSLREIQ